jgi:hypothetical protein
MWYCLTRLLQCYSMRLWPHLLQRRCKLRLCAAFASATFQYGIVCHICYRNVTIWAFLCAAFEPATLQGEIVCHICYSNIKRWHFKCATFAAAILQSEIVCHIFLRLWASFATATLQCENVFCICNSNVAMRDFMCVWHLLQRRCNVRLCAPSATTKLQFEIVCPICLGDFANEIVFLIYYSYFTV